jgi:cysteinyl-tRNA synthetase
MRCLLYITYNGAVRWLVFLVACESVNSSAADLSIDLFGDLLGSRDLARASTRGFPAPAPWVSFYGTAQEMGDLAKAAASFRILNIDADPDAGNFTPEQISQLRAGGQNRVISYLDLGSCENFRSYWSSAPSGLVPCGSSPAQIGPYAGYPDEVWMNPADDSWQRLVLEHIAPRLAATGVDGFFFDNLELLSHGTSTSDGPCDAACSQAGLDLVRKLREKFPDLLFVMQNGTADETRLGTTGGLSFPSLLDGISHEEVYAPAYDSQAEMELLAWQALGQPNFWIATEDYVGSCSNASGAMSVYQKSRAHGFSPYASDASAGQRVVCYW